MTDMPPGAIPVLPVSTRALQAAHDAWVDAQDTTGPDALLVVLRAAAPFIAADAVAAERKRVADKIRARISEIAMGADWRAAQVWRRLSKYGQGCIHGLDHALHMAEDRPHPSDPR